MFTQILVAVDGGDLTDTITAYALRLAGTAELHFLIALDPEGFFSDAAAAVFDAVGDRNHAIESAQQVVDRCVERANEAHITASAHVVQDRPIDAIVKEAELVKADLIVMASHGRSGLTRAVIGSVAEGVARRAPVAVLFVPTGRAADDPSRTLEGVLHGV